MEQLTTPLVEQGATRGASLKRAKELDGLRGIAALTVVFWHFFSLFPANAWTMIWKLSPLYVLIAGREAVVVFFVLSGFALQRMYLKSKEAGYAAFALRRTMRIYGPYFGALALAIAADYALSKGYRAHFSPWFNRTWTLPIHSSDVWSHVAFLGVYNSTIFNTAFWSLVHEMRISLLFPLLYLIVAAKGALRQIAVAISLLFAGSVAAATFASNTDFGDSVHFSALFVAGIFIAERKKELANRYRFLTRPQRILIATVVVMLFCYGRLLAHLLPASYSSLIDLPIGLGASGLVILAFSSPLSAACLTSKSVAWLGDISYSLYLIHGTILFALVNLLNPERPMLWLLCLYVPLTLLVASAFHAAVEKPLLFQSRKITATEEQHGWQSTI